MTFQDLLSVSLLFCRIDLLNSWFRWRQFRWLNCSNLGFTETSESFKMLFKELNLTLSNHPFLYTVMYLIITRERIILAMR